MIVKHFNNLGFWRNVRTLENMIPEPTALPVITGTRQAGAFDATFSDFDLTNYTCKCSGTANLKQSSSASLLSMFWFNCSVNSVSIQYKQTSGSAQSYLTVRGGFPNQLTIDKDTGTISFNFVMSLPYGFSLPSGYSFTGSGSISFDITIGK